MKKFAILIVALFMGYAISAQEVQPQIKTDDAVEMQQGKQVGIDSAGQALTGAAAVDPNGKGPAVEATAGGVAIPSENPYKALLTSKTFVFDIWSILRGVLGMAVLIFIAWIFSTDRKKIDWGTVGKALALQLIIAISMLVFPAVQVLFETFGKCFVAVLEWTKA
ncbi:MAG: Na+ dependent nucleoside transporter N-terminal domain-containing protein, partial [Eubacterium sp.]